MSNLTTLHSTSRPPDALRLALDLALTRASNALDEGGPLPMAALSRDERSALMARRVAINAALAPSSKRGVAEALATLSNMSRRGQPSEKMEDALAKQDVDDLIDLPEWAVSAACRAWRLAEIGDGHWHPTAGQIRAEAQKRMEVFVRERAKLARVLDAPVREPAPVQASPEQRKRVLDGLRALAAGKAVS